MSSSYLSSSEDNNNHNNNNNNQSPEQQEVNKIFSSNSIEQVATICRQMQQDVRLTQLELRNMIGNRHRELIDSCGELVGIDKVCRELMTICEEKDKREDEHRHGGRSGNNNSMMMGSRRKIAATGTLAVSSAAATVSSSSSSSATTDSSQQQQKWINDQLLRAMRATSLLQEQDLLDAAVQISILERDVSLGSQNILSSTGIEKSKNHHQHQKIISDFHALESTVHPLREQWNTAASKALAAMTNQHNNNNNNENNNSNSSSSSSLFTLASCFQGWGLLSRGSPKESLQHLLLDNLCKNAIQRILAQSGSTSEALTRCSKLLMFVSEFIVDLYKRGPLALVTSEAAAGGSSNNRSSSNTTDLAKSSSKNILQDLLRLDGNSKHNTSSAFPRSSSSNLSDMNHQNRSEPATPLTAADHQHGNSSSSSLHAAADPSSFLTALTHQVCALGVLDAENTFSNVLKNQLNQSSSSSSPSRPSSPTGAAHPYSASSTTTAALQGWASPLPASPGSPSSKTTSSSNFQDLLPTEQECGELFEQCCKILFASTMTKLIQRATDPGQGEASCLKIISFSSSSSSSSNLMKKIQQIVNTQICQVISSAAGSCILQHLSQCASEIIAFASQNNNNNNNNNTMQQQQQQQQYTLFHVARSVLFQANNESPLEPSSSSSASIRGRALLSSLMTRPSRRLNENNNNNTKGNANPSQRYHQQQLAQHLTKRGLSRSASPAAATSSTSGSLLLNSHLAKLNQLRNDTILHAKSALQRSLLVQNSDKSLEQVAEIILDLTTRLADSAKIFVANNTNTNNNSSKVENSSASSSQDSESLILQSGIAAAEVVRYITEPLTSLVQQTASSSSSSSQTSLNKSTETVKNLQTELLKPWKDQVKRLFEQEALMMRTSRTNAADDNDPLVATGTELICRSVFHTDGQQNQNSAFPSRPSPSVISALVNAVRRSTSLFTCSSLGNDDVVTTTTSTSNSNNNTSSVSAIFASSTTTSCPKHVRIELCAEICSSILKKGMEKVDEEVAAAAAASKKSSSSSSSFSTQQKEEFDLKLLQLYVDICFIVLVLRGTTSSLQHQVFATVDVLRKDFIKKIESAVDVLTWSVSKSNLNAAIKAVVDESSCVTSVLPSSSLTTTSSKSTGVMIPKTSALKMSVETASDRLPLLPLVALAPTNNSNNNNMSNNNSTTGAGVGGSSSLLSSSIFAGGGGGASTTLGDDNNTVERAAKELMAQGTAFTSKLKSVFQW